MRLIKRLKNLIGNKNKKNIKIKKVPAKQFRLQGKHLFLTYSQYKQKRERVLELLKEKLRPRVIDEFVIATEEHGAGGEHVHVYVQLDKNCDIENKSRLDLEDKDGKRCHGNYQSCRSYRNVVGYIIKDGLAKVFTNKKLDEFGRELNA